MNPQNLAEPTVTVQVAPKNRLWQRKIFIALTLIATLLIFIVLLTGSPPANSAEEQTTANASVSNTDSMAHAGLQQNLTHLRNQPGSFLSVSAQAPVNDRQLSARQNAPTMLYQADNGTLAASAAASQPINPVFSGTGDDSAFGNQVTTVSVVQAKRLPNPQYIVAVGEFIHATLETAIHSDLPGMVRAVISQPVYAYTGDKPLIPAGSRLIGQYSAGIVQGQQRVMVIWNRIILPKGISIQIDSPGTDALGRAGQGADKINRHFLEQFGQAALLSFIGAAASSAGVSPTDQNNSIAQYRAAMAQSFQQSAQQTLQNKAIKPTLTLYQGASINVFVSRDLSFENVLTEG